LTKASQRPRPLQLDSTRLPSRSVLIYSLSSESISQHKSRPEGMRSATQQDLNKQPCTLAIEDDGLRRSQDIVHRGWSAPDSDINVASGLPDDEQLFSVV